MKRATLKTWLIAATLVVAASASKAYAVTSQGLDIHVSITATKSLSTSATSYDFGALSVNVSSVSSSIVVTNASSALIETYRLQGANATSDSGGQAWTLAGSTGTDTYALAAQFATSQPSDADATFTSDDLTSSAVTCTDTVFGNGTHAQAANGISPSATRNLWFRLRTPDVVTDPSQHSVTVTLSVL